MGAPRQWTLTMSPCYGQMDNERNDCTDSPSGSHSLKDSTEFHVKPPGTLCLGVHNGGRPDDTWVVGSDTETLFTGLVRQDPEIVGSGRKEVRVSRVTSGSMVPGLRYRTEVLWACGRGRKPPKHRWDSLRRYAFDLGL